MRRIATSPLTFAYLFEGLLIPLALGLGWLLGLSPWADIRVSAEAVLISVAATAPLVVALGLFARWRPDWFQQLDALVRQLVDMLFRGRGPVPVVVVSGLAGLGEELLFRGVLQAGLGAWLGAWPGVVLAAIVFGLAHYLSRAYFVLAVGMGLYLGALYQLSGNLLLPILVHAFYDGAAIVFLLRRSDEGSTPAP